MANKIKYAVSPDDWVWLEGVNEIGKLYWISDKKDLRLFPHQIPVSIFGVKLVVKPRVAKGFR